MANVLYSLTDPDIYSQCQLHLYVYIFIFIYIWREISRILTFFLEKILWIIEFEINIALEINPWL